MYHYIVKRIARKNFERVNQKDYDAVLGLQLVGSYCNSLFHSRVPVIGTTFRLLYGTWLQINLEDVRTRAAPHGGGQYIAGQMGRPGHRSESRNRSSNRKGPCGARLLPCWSDRAISNVARL
jgi:hypothetical protein